MIDKPATKFTALARAEMTNSQCSWDEAWQRTQKKHPELMRQMASGSTRQARNLDRFKAIRSEFANDNVSGSLLNTLRDVMPPQVMGMLGLKYNSSAGDVAMMCRDQAPKMTDYQQLELFNALVVAIMRDSDLTKEKALEKAKEQFPELYKSASESLSAQS